jgi:hypothetical protein
MAEYYVCDADDVICSLVGCGCQSTTFSSLLVFGQDPECLPALKLGAFVDIFYTNILAELS